MPVRHFVIIALADMSASRLAQNPLGFCEYIPKGWSYVAGGLNHRDHKRLPAFVIPIGR
jgi:hypothetical protein